MAFVLADRVREGSSTTGAGALILNGTTEGFQTFDDALAAGDTTWYCVVNGAEWEVGLGTFTLPGAVPTLERTTVYSSSAGGSSVSLSPGVKDVFITAPASMLEVLQSLGSLGTAAQQDVGTGSGNIPQLDSGGKLPATMLPALAINDVFVVADQAAMLALTAQRGDMAVRSDENKTYVLAADTPATLASWVALPTPTDLVLSVAGLTGAISASGLKTALALVKGDVGLGNVDNVAVTGKHGLWIPAAAMMARTTAGAASGSIETATNKLMLKTLDFDASTQEFVQFALTMPKSWNEATVSFAAVWSHGATSANFGVAWSLAGVALSDDDAADAAFGTAVTVTDAGGTTSDLYRTAESGAVTIAGAPAELDTVQFQIARMPADAGDTLAVDARLHGIVLFITTNAGNDA